MSEFLLWDGLVNLHTRQFGKVVELIVQKLKDFQESGELSVDLFDPKSKRKIEVKSSRVFKKQFLNFDLYNLYDLLLSSSNKNRLLEQSATLTTEFDCNIQQIKVELFDTLYYVLFFYDVIEVFKIESEQIARDKNLNFSGKQHRGNVGEGQFHINQNNYEYHKSTYYVQSRTYRDLQIFLCLDREPSLRSSRSPFRNASPASPSSSVINALPHRA